MHQYLVDINNHCASPFLNWRTSIEKRHGYTPDISAFLLYQFYEPVYFRLNDNDKKSPELEGRWVGVDRNVGDALTFKIYYPPTDLILSRSLVRTADPERGAIINRQIHPDTEMKPIISIDSNSGGVPLDSDDDKEPRRSARLQKPRRSSRLNNASRLIMIWRISGIILILMIELINMRIRHI